MFEHMPSALWGLSLRAWPRATDYARQMKVFIVIVGLFLTAGATAATFFLTLLASAGWGGDTLYDHSVGKWGEHTALGLALSVGASAIVALSGLWVTYKIALARRR